MFKLVKGSTLAALREQAAQLPDLRQQLADAREDVKSARIDADCARADAEQARTAQKLIEDDRVIGLAALLDAARDPARGPSVRGLVAVRLLRGQIEFGKAEAAKNGREVDPGLRYLGWLLADETDDGARPVSTDAPADRIAQGRDIGLGGGAR